MHYQHGAKSRNYNSLRDYYVKRRTKESESPIKLIVKGHDGKVIPQWNNPSAKVHVEVQLFKPIRNYKDTAVVVIPGSGGGLPTEKAMELAEQGYPALAVQYFDYEPNSDYIFSITQVPLETFHTAITWLKTRSDLRINKVVLHGRSKYSMK